MMPSWAVTTAPVIEPLDLDELKDHPRVTHNREDGLIASYGLAARRAAESYMERGIMTQSVTAKFRWWSDAFVLPLAWPLQSVTSVKYADPDTGTLTTLATTYYDVDTTSAPGRVTRAPGQSWPGVETDNPFPIEIEYVVGYTAADLVDPLIVQGIRMHAAYLHLDREGMSADAEAARKSAERFWNLAGCLRVVESRCA